MFRRLFRTRRSASPPNANAPNANAPNTNVNSLIDDLERKIMARSEAYDRVITSLETLSIAVTREEDIDQIRRGFERIVREYGEQVTESDLNLIKRRFAYIVHKVRIPNTRVPNGLNTRNVNNSNKTATLSSGQYPTLGQMIVILRALKRRKNELEGATTRLRTFQERKTLKAQRKALRAEINRTRRQVRQARNAEMSNRNGSGSVTGSVTGSARSSRAASSANSVGSARSSRATSSANSSNLNLSGLA